ncbi:MAG: Alpha/beta hydrolase [Cyanobacteria bacterium RYN_339]|nr:Alpha/beta hydrolase [Cyanobacteria bacterium RYN_339]
MITLAAPRILEAATDNLILLYPGPGAGPVDEAASHLAGFGISRVAVLTESPDPRPYMRSETPVMLGELAADGGIALAGVAGRYGRGSLHGTPGRLTARDGATLTYRHHASDADTVAIVLHGASAHGDRYAVLAAWLREQGLAETYAPTLRGHHGSGPRRGDVETRDALVDDLADLVAHVRLRAPGKRIVLLAHSVAGGLALRYAAHSDDLGGLVLFAPYLGPGAPTERRAAGRGWVRVHVARTLGLAALGLLGVHAFDHLPILTFSPPLALRDGTETLTYSFRLARAFEPAGRPRCPTLVLAGEEDEVFEARAYPRALPGALLVQGASHLGVVFHPVAHAHVARWWATL